MARRDVVPYCAMFEYPFYSLKVTSRSAEAILGTLDRHIVASIPPHLRKCLNFVRAQEYSAFVYGLCRRLLCNNCL